MAGGGRYRRDDRPRAGSGGGGAGGAGRRRSRRQLFERGHRRRRLLALGSAHQQCLRPGTAGQRRRRAAGRRIRSERASPATALAFICQIAGFPQDDPCTTTPPANAYWSFWYAQAGQNTWTYSQSGAMNLAPGGGQRGGVGVRRQHRRPHRPPPSRRRTRSGPPPSGSCEHPTHHLTADASAPSTPPAGPDIRSARAPPPTGGHLAAVGRPSRQAVARRRPPGSAEGRPSTERTTCLGSTDLDHGGRARGRRPRRRLAGPGGARHHGQDGALRGSSTPPRRSPAPRAPNSPLPFLIGASAVAVLAAAGGVVARRRRRAG